jgi:hypothetical protein
VTGLIIAALITGFVGGAAAMAWLLGKVFKSKLKPANVDYKDRWLQAVSLLGDEGQLTADQVREIKGETATQVPPAPPAPAKPAQPAAGQVTVSATTLKLLHGMATWDRAAAEVKRAQRGLPPLDDLKGMATWDVKKVLEARIEHGTG